MAGAHGLPANPAEVTSNASVRPKPASAPSELVMPATASAASSAAAARATQGFGRRLGVVLQVERNVFRRRGGVGQAGIRVLRHHPRHRDGAFGQFREAGGSMVVDDTIAACWPRNTRRPRSRPSERSTCSVLPRRRATDSEVPEISTASAASAPAARARAIRSASRSSELAVMAGSTIELLAVPVRQLGPTTNEIRTFDPPYRNGLLP